MMRSTPILAILLVCLFGYAEAHEPSVKQLVDSCAKLNQANPESAFITGKQAYLRKDEITDPNLELKMYSELSMAANSTGMHAQALAYIEAGRKPLAEASDKIAMANHHLVFGHVLSHLEDFDEALNEYRIALTSFEAIDDSSGRSFAYSGMGNVYYDLDQPSEALRNYLKADSLWASADLALHADLFNNLGAVLMAFNRVEEARWYYNKALSTYAELDWKNSMSMVHFNLGEFYMNQGSYHESRQEYLKSLAIGEEIASLEEIKWAYFGLYDLERNLGVSDSALYYHELYHTYSDSLQKMLNLKEVDQLSKVYEQERIEKENLKLEAEKAGLTIENSRKEQLQNAMWIGFIALLVIILGGTYVIIRTRRTNSLLLIQKNDIIEKNIAIDEALHEKDLLLKEIHHRVKNNLQIISSLLNLQKHQVSPKAVAAFEESQNRIQAIALIHQKLYQSKSIARVNFGSYLMELIQHQQSLYHDGADSVKYHVETREIELNLDTAVPLGLIVAELIANAFKHAFKDVADKLLTLELEETPEGLTMVVRDNGIGLPQDFDQENLDSLGMDIVFALVEQLEGTIHFNSQEGKGTTCTIHFKDI